MLTLHADIEATENQHKQDKLTGGSSTNVSSQVAPVHIQVDPKSPQTEQQKDGDESASPSIREHSEKNSEQLPDQEAAQSENDSPMVVEAEEDPIMASEMVIDVMRKADLVPIK